MEELLESQAQAAYISSSSEHTSDEEEETISVETWASQTKNELRPIPSQVNDDVLIERFNKVLNSDRVVVPSRSNFNASCAQVLNVVEKEKIHGMEKIKSMEQEEKILQGKIENQKEKNEQLRKQCRDLKKQLSAAKKTNITDVKNAKRKLNESLREIKSLKDVEKVWKERVEVQATQCNSASKKSEELKDWYGRHNINITFKDANDTKGSSSSQDATLIKMFNVFPHQKELEVSIRFSHFNTFKKEFIVEGVTPDFENSEDVIREANESQNLPKLLIDCRNFLQEEYPVCLSPDSPTEAAGFNHSIHQRTEALFDSPD